MGDRFSDMPARIEQTISILSEMTAKLDTFELDMVPKIGRTSTSVLIPV